MEHVKPYMLSVGELRRLSIENDPIVIDLAGVSWIIAFPARFSDDMPTIASLSNIRDMIDRMQSVVQLKIDNA